MPASGDPRPCSIADALAVVGEKYSLLVLREVCLGNGRFDRLVRNIGAPRDVLATQLESWNVLVSTASSAQEALEKVIKERPDIVISDIGMPAEDGCQLLRNIRRLPPAEGGRTPAIALTAYARAEERSKSLVAGFNLHLAKPVEPAELLDALASLAPILEARR